MEKEFAGGNLFDRRESSLLAKEEDLWGDPRVKNPYADLDPYGENPFLQNDPVENLKQQLGLGNTKTLKQDTSLAGPEAQDASPLQVVKSPSDHEQKQESAAPSEQKQEQQQVKSAAQQQEEKAGKEEKNEIAAPAVPKAAPAQKQEVKQPKESKPIAASIGSKESAQAKAASVASANETESVQAARPKSAQEDPDFKAVVSKAKHQATTQQKHKPAKVEADSAQAAALSPLNEVDSQAQSKQVEVMDKQKAGTFNAAAFKRMLLERIQAILPKNEEQADKFVAQDKMAEVQMAATQQVGVEKEKAAGPIEKTVAAKPNKAAIKPREVKPLEGVKPGETPKLPDAKKAVPDARPDAEVKTPLKKNLSEVDQQMQAANVTQEQLAKSNEPQFLSALQAKEAAAEHTQTAPEGFRGKEKGVLTQAQAKAHTTGEQQMAAMHGERKNILTGVHQAQKDTGSKDTEERTKVANHINGIYEKTKADVESLLDGLDAEVNRRFESGARTAKAAFEKHVKAKMDAYKKERYGEWFDVSGWGNRISDAINGLPEEVNAFFTEGRRLYIEKMDEVLTEIADYVADKLNEAKGRIAQGKEEVQTYVTGLPESLQKIGKEAAEGIMKQFDALEQRVDDKQQALVDSLAQQYSSSLEAVDTQIAQMQAENRGLIDMAKEALGSTIETIKKMKAMLESVLANAVEAVAAILADPIGFLNNLIQGVKQGIGNFMANIGSNIQTALIEWLTGTLSSVGIQMPDDIFSLQGIFSLSTQVLGLTFDYIRSKAVKMFGEPTVQAMEAGVEAFQILRTEGAAGLWEHVKEQFGDLKETVIDSLKDMVITQVIESGIKWILSLLNPASAFVRAAIAIYDIVKFFIERAGQIAGFINAIADSIKAIASGSIAAVAQAIENAFARALPVVIGMLASLLGIGSLASKVQKLIGKIRQRIDDAIEKVLLKLKKLAKKVMRKMGLGKDIKEQNKKEKAEELTPKDKKEHAKIANQVVSKLEKTDKKDQKKTFEENFAQKKKEANQLEDFYQPQLKQGINIDIKFKPVKQDREDNDIDFNVVIAPNNTEEEGVVMLADVEDDREFVRILNKALKELGQELYKGFTKKEINKYNGVDEEPEFRKKETDVKSGKKRKKGQNPEVLVRSKEEDDKRLKEIKQQKEEEAEINREAKEAHDGLAALQIAYSVACMAKIYPNNTFKALGHEFFVDQTINYYIYPHSATGGGAYYNQAGEKGDKKDKEGKLMPYEPFTLIGPNDKSVEGKYNYGRHKVSAGTMGHMFRSLPDTKVDNVDQAAIFLAAMLAEPSRYSVAYVTHLLIALNPELSKETASNHMPMTDGGTDEVIDLTNKDEVKEKIDKRLRDEDGGNPLTDRNKEVTKKDLDSIKKNKKLMGELEFWYECLKEKEYGMKDENALVVKFKALLKDAIEYKNKQD